MSREKKSPTEEALDDLSEFMAGQRAFNDGVLFSKNKPTMWQSGYRQAIRNKVRDGGPINLTQRMLITKSKRFPAIKRSAAA